MQHICVTQGPQRPAPLNYLFPQGGGTKVAVPGGGGGGEGRDSNNNHILRFPPFPGHLFQEPWESPLSIGQQLASGGAQPPAVATEVGAAVRGVEKGGSGYPDLGANSRGGGSGSSVVWVVDVGADTAHWGASGRIPPQGGLQDYGTESSDREGWWVIIYPAGGSDGGFRVTGGGDLRLPPLENSHTVHCDQSHYEPERLSSERHRSIMGLVAMNCVTVF